ncbi:DUF3152 domain-containing protein [Streptomyces olivaceus]|uniref:DUF3152 domain-containing protein n=1 Tax=Streptomyces olivaceus TaxID=47716 RepID=UPI001CCC0908|nr:DUF3152 domain-containing protein [Streptomyces olivaceus]MBZ6285696.1 DUF3152 domain-containing protein [Streptomyces olivaceus]
MGRHSRRGPAPKADAADPATPRKDRPGVPGRPAAGPPQGQRTPPPGPRPPGNAPRTAPGGPWAGPQGAAPQGQGQGQRFPDGRFPDGTPAHGFPTLPGGVPARGFPDGPDGTPAHGVPGLADGTPARGVPQFTDGTPAHGVPRVRGGHPEQRETGGGWGELGGRTAPPGQPARPGPSLPRQRQGPPQGPPQEAPQGRRQDPGQGPRQEYLDAFAGDDDVFAARAPHRTAAPARSADPYSSVTDWSADDGVGNTLASAAGGDDGDDAPPTGEPVSARGGKGRAFTGVAAAAVTTVLAVVVAGQVADGSDAGGTTSQSAAGQARDAHGSSSRADERATPSAPAPPLTYEQKLGKRYPLGADLKGSGKFDAIPGIAKAPGTGQKYTYRVDVEQGLGLDGELFADAVQKTLNDQRSWAHNGARTFERIHSGQPDFVITLASPGTTAEWCAKSGLDTTEDNVSCDSAATERVMINAYRWAQGAKPYGDAILPYRQMLINHEVGHRLGHNHVTCDKDGELAPVMQQQTKFLDHDGIHCRPNPWAYPNG